MKIIQSLDCNLSEETTDFDQGHVAFATPAGGGGAVSVVLSFDGIIVRSGMSGPASKGIAIPFAALVDMAGRADPEFRAETSRMMEMLKAVTKDGPSNSPPKWLLKLGQAARGGPQLPS